MTAGPETVEAESAVGDDASTKRAYVRRIFSEIAPRYDLLNHVLSLNIDRAWRTKAIAALEWERNPRGLYLDLCSGTLDIAVKLAGAKEFRGQVIASDFAVPMLHIAQRKVGRLPVVSIAADVLSLPVQGDHVDGAIVGFGARNLADLDAGLREVFRVLRPGGRFVILEFATPQNPIVRRAYHAYFHHVLPRIGRLVSGHRTAYEYLPRSVAKFPSQQELASCLTRAGFVNVHWRSLTFGIAAIHVADKPLAPRSPLLAPRSPA
ncbi:MAG TPA: bifunctional demethylmenaquinone methyltransferase/2-methoxy-6-polyprenyl-1,4-benzoquinol methylase UbiE [Gemmatimonadaceae bacterium]|nr:bifunctional demethylmenaquinone methyltransferase/2-methoxy-6-polyprenyl-1,4-benzoquinol methylase UbiE [Gemmatimonadaceae bacterium]